MESSRPKTVFAAVVGGGLFVAIMLALAGVAFAFGLIRPDNAGRLDLEGWLVVEIIGSAVASTLAGALSRRVAGGYRGPAVLAAGVLSVGLLEATAILRYTTAGGADAPAWLVLLAPVVAAAGVLLGGGRAVTHPRSASRARRSVSMTEALRYGVPVTVLAAATALSLFVLPGLGDGVESQVTASAVALDFTVSVPALVFFLLVRAKRAPWIVIVPTFVVGYAVAAATIPEQHHGVLDLVQWLAVPAELVLVVYMVLLTRKTWKQVPGCGGDFATRFRRTARQVIGARIPADILTTEIAILYYAFRWGKPRPERERVFTVHREAAYLAIVMGLAMAIVVEAVALHAFVRQWSGTSAWILTGLSIYTLVWFVGDYRAIVARPIVMRPTRLTVRLGLRWEADIPIDQVSDATVIRPQNRKPNRDILVAAVLGQPNLRLMLKEPVEVIGLYGVRRTVRELWLRVDGVEELVDEVDSMIAKNSHDGSQPGRRS